MADTSWDDMEAVWRGHNRYSYKRTDIVSLLREANGHVRAFIRNHPETVAAIQASVSATALADSSTATQDMASVTGNTAGEQEEEGTPASSGRRRQRDEAEPPLPQGGSGSRSYLSRDRCDFECLCSLKNDAEFEALYKHVVRIQAPMVRFSRPPFRKLCRLWGTDISYTHMILADSFIRASGARHAEFGIYTDEDRLVVQLAAKDGPTAAQAARMLLPYCDAFDLNCGCPQRWAMKEGLGSALLKKPELVADMVKCIRNGIEGFHGEPQCDSGGSPQANTSGTATAACAVKMRVDEDVRRSVDFARQVAAAGASWITVHGRTPMDAPTARVRYEAIRVIQEDLDKSGVPVVVNGGVVNPSTAVFTALASEVGSVMSANGLLDNPAAFFLPESGQAILDELTFEPHTRTEAVAGGPAQSSLLALYSHLEQEELAQEAQLQRTRRQKAFLLSSARPENPFVSSAASFRPLWALPTTPLEVVSDFLRLALHMDLPSVTTAQQLVRLGRSYLAPTERVSLSHLKSNMAMLSYFDELGLYIDRGHFTL